MTFKDLGLSQEILDILNEIGYEKPTPIQEKAIPVVLDGRDILASAQTGTGKTAGFTLPILQKFSAQRSSGRPVIKALILTPTRELAAQIFDNVKQYSANLNLKSTVIFGGVNQNPQKTTLQRGVDILIATPGRLLDLHQQNALSLKEVQVLVLDEADRMLDMGFQRDINKILKLLPNQKQTLLFSATFSREIKELASRMLNNPVSVEASPQNTTAEKVTHKIYKVDKQEKPRLLSKLIKDGNWEQVLVFTRTKHGANKLCEKLIKSDISASAIHGNKSQNARTKALDGFKKGRCRVLVATDIAARGLDIPLLPHVVNYELPNVSEDYIHRIGRTGRAGAKGEAISLVDVDENEYVKGIEKLLGEKIDSEILEGFEPTNRASTKAELAEKKRGNQGRRSPKKSFGKRNSPRGGNRRS